MLGDLSGAESLKLICDVGEAIKRELDIFIIVSLEAVEEVAKNTDPLTFPEHSHGHTVLWSDDHR